MIALDGTAYHHSHNIHCNHCTETTHSDGSVSYQHTVVTPVVVRPENSQVIALEPEFVVPQDGHEKQDCETAAAKRWIESHGKFYASFGATLLGDDLYSRQPMCEKALAAGFNFIFVCKPASHVTVYEWVDNLNKINEVSTHQVHYYHRGKKLTDIYRFVSDIPLRNSKDALFVNWLAACRTMFVTN